MRSVLIIATLTIGALAMPVPEVGADFSIDAALCHRIGQLIICGSQQGQEASTQTLQSGQSSIETGAIRNEGRSAALSRPKNPHGRANENTGAVTFANKGRSPTLHRPKGSRDIIDLEGDIVDESEEDLNASSSRSAQGTVRTQARGAVRTQARGAVRTQARGTVRTQGRSVESSSDGFKAAIRGKDKRTADADPINRIHGESGAIRHSKRTA